MMRKTVVKKGVYRDSITLLRVTKVVRAVGGVHEAAVVMATPLNKRVLGDIGFSDPDVDGAGNDDMVVAVEAEGEKSLSDAFGEADRLLSAGEASSAGAEAPRTLDDALSVDPDANLAVVSVPGRYAKREAMRALDHGLNVFLFSSNVSRSDERELKEAAVKKHLLMMGPDCGTAIINHTVLGFGNSVRRGAIGMVSASGTGLQEVATMIHAQGQGLSQAIGTGGGDLSDEVGGIMTLEALRLLEGDPETRVIVVVSKPPGPKTEKAVLDRVAKLQKPVVLAFLGADVPPEDLGGHLSARTLDEAARLSCGLAEGKAPQTKRTSGELLERARAESSLLSEKQKYVRGLFAGGTLCYEAQVVMTPLLGGIHSNSALDRSLTMTGSDQSVGHTCIDMGSEEFVVGRAHPMIDFTLRRLRIIEEAKDPGTAVLLFDVELGIGSNPDPAGELVPVILEAKSLAKNAGRHLPVVVSMVGTDGDFQGLERQTRALAGVGAIVVQSNAEAAAAAAQIAMRGSAGPSFGGKIQR